MKTSARRLAAAILALALVPLVLAACGGSDDDGGSTASTAEAAAASGPWSFTDDRGVTVELDETPETIVAYDTAGSALWYQGIVPAAIFGGAPLSQDNALFDGLDVSQSESIGEVYGEINLEKLAALEPDLVVTAYDPAQELPFGFKNEQQLETVESFAPVVAIDSIPVPSKVIERFGELADALGADPEDPERVEARERFEAAAAALQETAAEKTDISVAAVGPFEDGLYFAQPARFPALEEYADWGVRFTSIGDKPTAKSKEFQVEDFWQVVSYEQADRYPADLILHDILPGSLDLETLDKKPTWRALPAVQAGQLVPWRKLQAWSYPLYADEIEQLTEGLEAAQPVAG